eukprot:g9163.t1
MANPPDAVHFRMPGVPELDASIELEHRPRRPSSNRYEFVIATIMTLNVLWMALELQVYGYFDAYDSGLVSNFIVPPEERSLCDTLLLAGDLLFAALFVIDVVIALLPIDAFFFRLVRFGKLFRTDFVGPWDCTFTRSILTMFEVLFANWGPPCRALTDNVSEWFSLFFLFYRCVIGFAVLNVVGAVFVQQTMKMANSDEETANYARKVRKLFSHMDDSGDGALSHDEFAKLAPSLGQRHNDSQSLASSVTRRRWADMDDEDQLSSNEEHDAFESDLDQSGSDWDEPQGSAENQAALVETGQQRIWSSRFKAPASRGSEACERKDVSAL